MGSGVSSDKAAYHHRGVSNVPVSVGPVHQILVRNGLRSLILSLTAGKVNKSKTYPVNDDIYCSDLKAANTEVPHPIKDASHNVPQLEIPIVSEVPIVRHARNSGMRASAVMMAKLIHDTVPEYKSYTEEEPSADELAMANRVRLLLSAPSKYLEFYTTVYEILYDSSAMRSFPIRTITFKNTFLSELMKLIVTAEDNSKTSFAEKVQYFGTKYKNEGIEVMEYGQFGQAIVTAMRKVEKQDQNLWPKVYSRFLRTLVPYMIIQTSKSIMEDSPLARTFTAPLFGATPSWQLRAQHSSQNMLTQQQQYQYQQARQLSNTFSTKSDGSTRSHPSVVDEAVQILREECDGELEC